MSLDNGSVRVSGSIFGNFHCSWSIPNFSAKDGVIQSEIFTLQDDSLKWNLKIDTKFEGSGGKRSLCCYLMLVSSKYFREICVKEHFSLRSSVDKVLWYQESEEWGLLKDGQYTWYSEAIERDALIEKLIGDILILSVNVTYCEASWKDNDDVFLIYSAAICPVAKLLQDLESLLTDEEDTDIVLSVGAKKIPVHSKILTARSKGFKAMLQKDIKKKKRLTVEITDFKSAVIDALIEFIYTGNVKFLSMDVALELLRASHKYDMEELMNYSSGYLISKLNDENVVQVLIKANLYNALDLKTEAQQYVTRRCRGREIIKKHRPLLKKHPDVLLDILEAEIDDEEY